MRKVVLVIETGACVCRPHIPSVAEGKRATQPVNIDETIKHTATVPLGILEESMQRLGVLKNRKKDQIAVLGWNDN